MHSRRRIIIASLLALLWLAAMLAAFWWFQARYIRPFDERTELFIGSQLRLPEELAGPGAIRLVHFWDPACPCNVGNQQHLGELVEQFAPRGVQFYAVQKAGSEGVRFDVEGSGYGFRTVRYLEPDQTAQPHSCKMAPI